MVLKKEPGRREIKKKTTRNAIFQAAQKLFNAKGFENTSVEDITECVNIAQSTFFNYFPRKEDILVEIFKRKLPFLKKVCREVLQSKEPLKAKIHKIFSATAEIAAKNENITRAVLINTITSPVDRQYDGFFFDDFRKTLSLVLEKGQHECIVRNDVSAIKLANLLEGTFTLFIVDCLIKKNYTITSSELFSRLDICLEGIMTEKIQ